MDFTVDFFKKERKKESIHCMQMLERAVGEGVYGRVTGVMDYSVTTVSWQEGTYS